MMSYYHAFAISAVKGPQSSKHREFIIQNWSDYAKGNVLQFIDSDIALLEIFS